MREIPHDPATDATLTLFGTTHAPRTWGERPLPALPPSGFVLERARLEARPIEP